MLAALAGLAPEAMAAAKKVAVYATGQVSAAHRSVVNSAALGQVSRSKEYVAYERNEAFVDAMNAEQDYQVGGEVPDGEIRKVGARHGVDYVIVVNTEIMGEGEGVCHMAARLIELESGKIVKSVNLKRKMADEDVIPNMANNVAYRLLNSKSK